MRQLFYEPRQVVRRAIIIGLVVCGAGVIMGQWTFVLGLVYGATVGVLDFRLLEIACSKALRMTPLGASKYLRRNYLVRYVLKGAVLATAIGVGITTFVATALGLLIIKLSIYLGLVIDGLRGSKYKKKSE